MDEVRKILDFKLKKTEKNLVNKILSYIDGYPEHNADFCDICRRLESVHSFARVCKNCKHKYNPYEDYKHQYDDY